MIITFRAIIFISLLYDIKFRKRETCERLRDCLKCSVLFIFIFPIFKRQKMTELANYLNNLKYFENVVLKRAGNLKNISIVELKSYFDRATQISRIIKALSDAGKWDEISSHLLLNLTDDDPMKTLFIALCDNLQLGDAVIQKCRDLYVQQLGFSDLDLDLVVKQRARLRELFIQSTKLFKDDNSRLDYRCRLKSVLVANNRAENKLNIFQNETDFVIALNILLSDSQNLVINNHIKRPPLLEEESSNVVKFSCDNKSLITLLINTNQLFQRFIIQTCNLIPSSNDKKDELLAHILQSHENPEKIIINMENNLDSFDDEFKQKLINTYLLS